MNIKPTTDLAFVAFMLRSPEISNDNTRKQPSGALLIALSALDRMFKGK